MRSLLILDGDLGELNEDQKEALGWMVKAFNGDMKFNKDIEQILNCEFCLDGEK
jgi:hypothetical protein